MDPLGLTLLGLVGSAIINTAFQPGEPKRPKDAKPKLLFTAPKEARTVSRPTSMEGLRHFGGGGGVGYSPDTQLTALKNLQSSYNPLS